MRNAKADRPAVAVLILAVVCLGGTIPRPATVIAQTAQTAPAEPAEENSSHVPNSLPHVRFLLDYLLVLALLAGAVYAVCRSSRRL